MARKLTGDEDFAGLKTVEKTLPGRAYYDPAIYQRVPHRGDRRAVGAPGSRR
jgi:hypothetical protein